MGATSVTGVSGAGSAAGLSRGSEHWSLGVNKLVGPHIVAAGGETLSGTDDVIEIPAQAAAITEYFVLVSNDSSTHAYISTALATQANGGWDFTITAGSGDVVKWAVVRVGMG